jgi:hypothetical protein
MNTAAASSKALRGIDFIDLGASSGNSMQWASKAFGGQGLGIDLSAEKVAAAEGQGLRMMRADARNLDLPSDAVRYCVLMDFLEHLPNAADAEAVIETAFRLAREFIFIALPNFDNERFLRELNLKRYYADWSGHSLHLRTPQLQEFLARLGGQSDIYRYGEIFDTFDRSIIPLDAPRNSSFYDPAVFGPREYAVLPRKKLYTRTLAVIAKDKTVSANDILCRAMTTLGYLQPL